MAAFAEVTWWPELLCWGAAVEEKEEEEGWGEEEEMTVAAVAAAPEAAGRGVPSAFWWPRPWYRLVPSLCVCVACQGFGYGECVWSSITNYPCSGASRNWHGGPPLPYDLNRQER